MRGDILADILLIASRLLWYLGILGVIGASAFRLLVLARLGTTSADLHRGAAAAGQAAATVLLAGTIVRLYAQTYVSFGLDEPVTAELLVGVATDLPPWSTGWQLQVASGVVALLAFATAHRGHAAGWRAAHLAALAVAVSAPLTGHAVAQAEVYLLPVVSQAAHVMGAGIWIGGLGLLVWLRRDAQEGTRSLAALVNAFSTVALCGAGLIVSTGAVTAILYLPDTSDLWTTPYGRTLSAKLAAVAAVGAVGCVNWQYVRPRLGDPAAATVLRRVASLELLLALAVLALTALLVGLPQPGE